MKHEREQGEKGGGNVLLLEPQKGDTVKDGNGRVIIGETQVVREIPRPLDPHAPYLAQVQRREDAADLRFVGLQLPDPGAGAEMRLRKCPQTARVPADRVRAVEAERWLADAHHEQ